MGPVSKFLEKHYRHFNARETVDAAKAFRKFLDDGGKMLVSLAGAMSTGELGVILARMIRAGHVHALSVTGANLEEDLFNLIGRDHYKMVPNYRDLSPKDEEELRDAGFSRVTDTCINEDAWMSVADLFIDDAKAEGAAGRSHYPYEYFYRMIRSGALDGKEVIPREDSWMIAACEKNLPVFSPGWEDSTIGNIFAASVFQGKVPSHAAVKSGTHQFEGVLRWYLEEQKKQPIGFFQIGGGIAGDFAICTVPSIKKDLELDCRVWGYFCQISDSTTSYGSYSGAVPNEKITWLKLDADTPKYLIESDASIVAPLIFAWVLGD
jgi:deoxyhypusine synthase